MKIVIFTANAPRHAFVANTLATHADDVLIISEQRASDAPTKAPEEMTLVEAHFAERHAVELEYFGDHQTFTTPVLSIPYKEANSTVVYERVQEFAPDMGFVFGASIIRDPLLSLIPSGRFVNMHLGLSPYYRGSGTNFWPFINEELEYVGATLLHIDAGIDTGDIITHARPTIERGDTVHTVGNKTIIAGTEGLMKCLTKIRDGEELPRTKQWEVPNEHYYKNKDFTDESVALYRAKLADGLVERYLASEPKAIKVVEL